MATAPARSSAAAGGELEIRIAVVLYGGVSLAIYENGVTRTLWDLSRREGAFGPLLKMLGARAIVDVIAGASAGGINGLMLGVALESGDGFDAMADLWREQGDFGRLLHRDPAAKGLRSLLDGEGYYQDRLREAFDDVIKAGAGAKAEGRHAAPEHEIDVLVPGTLFEGAVATRRDDLDAKVPDRAHPVTFHLKSRPGRTKLGETRVGKGTLDRSHVLATIARITSSFPVAFPAFRSNPGSLATAKEPAALAELCRGKTEDLRSKHLIDGGAVDNKPFAAAIDAMFRRMPTGPVSNWLFYCEPDPQDLGESRPADEPLGALAVAGGALLAIPSHQSVGRHFERLDAHDGRVQWARERRKELLTLRREGAVVAPPGADYHSLRIDSTARSLTLEWDRVPCAADRPPPTRQRLYELVRERLRQRHGPRPGQPSSPSAATATLDQWDVEFALRGAFFVLDRIDDRVNEIWRDSADGSLPEVDGNLLTALGAVGRVVKVLEVTRSALAGLRDSYLETDTRAWTMEDVVTYLATVRAILCTRCTDAWKEVHLDLESTPEIDAAVLSDADDGPFSQKRLTKLNDGLRSAVQERRACRCEAPASVLARLYESLAPCVRRAGMPHLFEDFLAVDAASYPAEFAAGLFELDVIRWARISREDAKIRCPRLAPSPCRIRLAGDAIGHFSGFLRRDWRSHDILWGRLHAIDRVVSALLSPEDDADRPILLRRWAGALTPGLVEDLVKHVAAEHVTAVGQAADAFRAGATDETLQRLRDALVAGMQCKAVEEDIGTIESDRLRQDSEFKMRRPAPPVADPNPCVRFRAMNESLSFDHIPVRTRIAWAGTAAALAWRLAWNLQERPGWLSRMGMRLSRRLPLLAWTPGLAVATAALIALACGVVASVGMTLLARSAAGPAAPGVVLFAAPLLALAASLALLPVAVARPSRVSAVHFLAALALAGGLFIAGLIATGLWLLERA